MLPVRVGYVRDGSNLANVPSVNDGRSQCVDALVAACVPGLLDVPVRLASRETIVRFHSNAYWDALVRGEPCEQLGLSHDCAPFPGLLDHVKFVAGASLSACDWLLQHHRDGVARAIALNFHGGRHHAHASTAAGFCFVQDVVLAALFLRARQQRRIVYIDLDIHFGDAVAEAFDGDDEFLFISMHLHERGFFASCERAEERRGNIVNVPLRRGLRDGRFMQIFDEKVLPAALLHNPDVVIVQMGCDGLAGDPLGRWNLSTRAYEYAMDRLVTQFTCALLVLGGGGYNTANAARCWMRVAATAMRMAPLPLLVPDTLDAAHFALFGPDFVTDVMTCKVTCDLNDV